MPTTLESSKQFWDEKAKKNPYWYVSSYGPYEGRNLYEFWQSGHTIWKELKAAIEFVPHGTVVEIGCGVGRLTRAIAPEVERVTSFDISSEMIDIARQAMIGNVNFVLTKGSSLFPVPDASADLVLAYCVFQHLPSVNDFRSYLCEMVRVVKPGGTVAFTICERDWRWSVLPLMRLKGFVNGKMGLQPPDLHKREWLGIRPSIAEIKSMCVIPLHVKQLGGGRTLLWGVAQ